MNMRFYSIVVDCHDIAAQSAWWAEALGWRVAYQDEHEVSLVPQDAPEGALPAERWASAGPGLCFVPVEEGKTVKNRLHVDLAPHSSDDRDAQIARLEGMGATRVEVGQDDKATWTVLADPEGNEFCVLSARDE